MLAQMTKSMQQYDKSASGTEVRKGYEGNQRATTIFFCTRSRRRASLEAYAFMDGHLSGQLTHLILALGVSAKVRDYNEVGII
uniref:Uncharacterized protein n=1 Tax=Parascaris equorum TaxID=6256 RepID=A0A914RRZ8_PAREQ